MTVGRSLRARFEPTDTLHIEPRAHDGSLHLVLVVAFALVTAVGCVRGTVGTKAGSHESALTKADVGRVLSATRKRMRVCSPHTGVTVTITLRIEGSGSATILKVDPDADARLVECVHKVVASMRFSRNDGRTPTITWPVIFN